MKAKSTNFIVSIALLFITLNADAQSWLTTGNTGTTPSKNFLGTKDLSSLVFKTSNLERMRIASTGKIGIGTQSPTQKLDVHGNINLTDTLYFPGRYATGAIYADDYGLNINSLFDASVYIGSLNQSSTALSATSADNAIGANSYDITIEGYADNPNHYDFLSSGVLGFSNGSLGIAGLSDSSYGVYGTTNNTKSYAGYFDGSIYSTGIFIGSDETLKQNVQDFSSAINIINQLHPKTYQYRQDNNYKLMSLPQGQHYGLIAQDVEKVLPNLVKETKFNTAKTMLQKPVFDPNNPGKKINFKPATTGEEINFKALNYTEFIPLLIKGMQEQQQSIEDLKQINQQQQAEINQLKDLLESKLGVKTAGTLSSASLLQNVPNPYNNGTTISYNLPVKFSSAKIIVTDNSGKVLKQISVSSAGKGSINVDASTLAAGIYNYSLWIDKRLIDTKQMVLQK